MLKVGVYIPAQVFLGHPLVDLGLLLRGGALVRPPPDPLGVYPVGLHFPVFDGLASYHPPMDIGHGVTLLFRLLVTLLITLTGASRGTWPREFLLLHSAQGYGII